MFVRAGLVGDAILELHVAARVAQCTAEAIPYRPEHSVVAVVMLRAVRMVNLMLCRRHQPALETMRVTQGDRRVAQVCARKLENEDEDVGAKYADKINAISKHKHESADTDALNG